MKWIIYLLQWFPTFFSSFIYVHLISLIEGLVVNKSSMVYSISSGPYMSPVAHLKFVMVHIGHVAIDWDTLDLLINTMIAAVSSSECRTFSFLIWRWFLTSYSVSVQSFLLIRVLDLRVFGSARLRKMINIKSVLFTTIRNTLFLGARRWKST